MEGRPLEALRNVYRLTTRHPLGVQNKGGVLKRFLTWQIGSRVLGRPVALEFVGGSQLLTRTGMTGATVNHYVGLYEFEDMAFTLHTLHPSDLFIDVGANIGSYTVLASAVAGAKSLAFEPVPATFRHLRDNVNLNALNDRVMCLNVGLGSKDGILHVTMDRGSMNRVVMDTEESSATVEVPIRRLDDVVAERRPLIVKVDVEGWETEVIAGAEGTLAGQEPLAVIMELNGSGARYGFDEVALHERMLDLRFAPAHYRPMERELTLLDSAWTPLASRVSSTGNTLYLRDVDFFRHRVREAKRFEVLGLTI